MLVFTRTLASVALFLFLTGVECRMPVATPDLQNKFFDIGKETFKALAQKVPVGKVGEFLASPWLSTISSVTSIAGMGWLIYKELERTQEWENERQHNTERFEEIQKTLEVMNDAFSQMSINERKYVDTKFNTLNERFDVMDTQLSKRLEEDRRSTAKQLNIVNKGLQDLKDQLIQVSSEDSRSTAKQLNIVNKGLQDLKDQMTHEASSKVDQELHKLEDSITKIGRDISQQFAEERKHRDEQFDQFKNQLLLMLQAEQDYVDNKLSAMKTLLEAQELEIKEVYERLQKMQDQLTLQSIHQGNNNERLQKMEDKLTFQSLGHPEHAINQPVPALNQQVVPYNKGGIQNQETPPPRTNPTCHPATADQAQEHMHGEL